MRFLLSIICFLIPGLFFSCATSIGEYRSSERLIEKQGSPGKKSIAVLRLRKDSHGEEYAEFTSPFFPAISMKGDLERNEDGFVFFITRAQLFAQWPNGWTQGLYEASGKLIFQKEGDEFKCYTADPFEMWDIISGEIRYNDVYYRNDDGARKVKNRVDRMIESSRFLREINNTFVYGSFKSKTTYGRGFKTDVTRFLFPERGGFKKLETHHSLPDVYYENKSKFQEKKVWGAGLWWRIDYTMAVFPEHLWQLRDTGTLWRDFEEAPLLFYSLYNLKFFFDVLLKDKQLSFFISLY